MLNWPGLFQEFHVHSTIMTKLFLNSLFLLLNQLSFILLSIIIHYVLRQIDYWLITSYLAIFLSIHTLNISPDLFIPALVIADTTTFMSNCFANFIHCHILVIIIRYFSNLTFMVIALHFVKFNHSILNSLMEAILKVFMQV